MYDHIREDEEITLLISALYVLWNSFMKVSWTITYEGSILLRAQPENSHSTHLFTEPLPPTSKREKSDESLFRLHFSQLSTSRTAALILEVHINAVNNTCSQSFFGCPHFLPIFRGHASVDSISAKLKREATGEWFDSIGINWPITTQM